MCVNDFAGDGTKGWPSKLDSPTYDDVAVNSRRFGIYARIHNLFLLDLPLPVGVISRMCIEVQQRTVRARPILYVKNLSNLLMFVPKN